MALCRKCEFRTRYPGNKLCWQLDKPLCGNCAYEYDQAVNAAVEKFKLTPAFKKFVKKKIEPIMSSFFQIVNPLNIKFININEVFEIKELDKVDPVELYEKMYVRKPSTKGGRFSEKSLNNGGSLLTMIGS